MSFKDIFGFDAREFFGMPQPSPYPEWFVKYERTVVERALKLAEGLAPEGNLAPYLELVRAADALKLDAVRRS